VNYNIAHIEEPALRKSLEQLLLKKSKPSGALGFLGSYAVQMGLIQQKLQPRVKKPCLLLFAADHGFALGDFLQEAQIPLHERIISLLQGDGALNNLLKATKVQLRLVDVGVAYSFENSLVYWLHHGSTFVDRKLKEGSEPFMSKPAMSTSDCKQAMQVGADVVLAAKKQGSNTLVISDWSNNSIPAAVALCISLLGKSCTKALVGNLLNEAQYTLVEKASKRHPKSHDALTNLTVLGGFDLAAMTGAFLQAANQRQVAVVDGFTSAVAALCAVQMHPAVADYCVFATAHKTPLYQHILKQFKQEGSLNSQLVNNAGINGVALVPLLKNAVSLLD
jgi:nicotinate-nucleotide--dimethylbenzimidazole phosphoribosyltransferase